MTSAKGRGRPQAIDRNGIAVLALLLMRRYPTVRDTDASRAAVKAFLAWTGDPTELPAYRAARITEAMRGMVKSVQRLKTGKLDVHPDIVRMVGIVHKETGEPVVGRPHEIADSVARFLPERIRKRLGILST